MLAAKKNNFILHNHGERGDMSDIIHLIEIRINQYWYMYMKTLAGKVWVWSIRWKKNVHFICGVGNDLTES